MTVPGLGDAALGTRSSGGVFGRDQAQVGTDRGAGEAVPVADLDREGTERALVLPNYGVPVPDAAFAGAA